MAEKLHRISELVADGWGSRDWLTDEIRAGRIHAVQLGGRTSPWRIPQSELDRLLGRDSGLGDVIGAWADLPEDRRQQIRALASA